MTEQNNSPEKPETEPTTEESSNVEAPGDGAADSESSPATDERFSWFAVYVYSGHERKVMGNLKRRIELSVEPELFGMVVVPTEEVVTQREGRSTKSTRPFFPGYVIFQMVARDHNLQKADDKDFINATNLVLTTPGVRGFVGGRRDPAPLDSNEVARILHTEERTEERVKTIPFAAGDHVTITEGAFANFDGTVEELIPDRLKVIVAVTVFGRSTPVEVDVAHLRKS